MSRAAPPRWTAALLVVALAAGCGGTGEKGSGSREAAGESASGGGSARSGLSLLLVSIDTCRPDHLGCYGGEAATPNLDRLAAEGVRFDAAVATAPITLPSHASLFTSEFPYRHRVRNNGTYRLPEEKLTLAERMKGEGYGTAAFVGAFPLDSRFGLARGFDVYDDRFPPAKVGDFEDIAERSADTVVDSAVAWLEEERRGPFFLFVHFFDPHWPYAPPEPFASMYENRYDGEIAFVDGEIGRLLDELGRLGLAQKTLVIVTGDHGESLGDHGEVTHSVFTYDATIRVPLLIRWPDAGLAGAGAFRRGSVVASQVREVDIAPTALDLLGLPPMPDAEGVSLAPLLADPGQSLGLVNYAESFSTREDYWWSEVRSIRTDRWKYIRLPEEELYDLRADPGELRNVVNDEKDAAARMRALLDERVAEDESRSGESAAIEIDKESRARLEALGYVTGGGNTPAETSWRDLPDPKERVRTLVEYFAARALIDAGKAREAVESLSRLADEEPENPRVIGALADAYLVLDDFENAAKRYAAAVPLLPGDLSLRSNYASVFLRTERVGEAIEILRSVLEADPRFENGHARLGEALFVKGDLAGAGDEFRRELENYPDSPQALNGLGKIERLEGRFSEAGRYYLKAIELRPDYAEAIYNLANLYGETGQTEKAIGYYKKAIDADPNLVEAYYNLALLAKQYGQRQTAATLLVQALERNPRFAKGYFGLGNLYREDGRLTEAVRHYRLALEYGPEDADIYLNLGVAYAGMGDLVRAMEAWEEAVRVDPSSASAQTAADNLANARSQRGGVR